MANEEGVIRKREVLADTTYEPKGVHLGKAKVPYASMLVDGAIEPMKGDGMIGKVPHRVVAAIGRGVVLFTCQCGFTRSVIDSEKHFHCETEKVNEGAVCDILWHRKEKPSGTFDPVTGEEIMIADMIETVTGEVTEDGYEVKRRIPQFWGEPLGQARNRVLRARRLAGQADIVQPQGPTSQQRAEQKLSHEPQDQMKSRMRKAAEEGLKA